MENRPTILLADDEEAITAETSGRECAQKVRPGEYRPSVYQASAYRASVYRPSLYRPSAYRPLVCVTGDCIPAVNVPAVNVPAINVPARTLASRTLPEVRSRCVRVLSDRASTVYDVCADVRSRFSVARTAAGRSPAVGMWAPRRGDDRP